MVEEVLSEVVRQRAYAKWTGSRRESWSQTIDRYLDFLLPHTKTGAAERSMLRTALLRQDVVGSMRAMWSAGPVAERCNVSIYNCASLPIDSCASVAELMYISMQGTGCGFSVERQFTENFPAVGSLSPIPSDLDAVFSLPYLIEDSSEGWADSVLYLLASHFYGKPLTMDYSLIRPAGAPLKTKGGTASGPDVLRELHDFINVTMSAAVGRKLRPIEWNDICCKIGDVVFVGGVRRTALISISDPDDLEMRDAKQWMRGDIPSFRARANNSAYYASRPTREQFDAEWKQLVESGAGERGFLTNAWSRRNPRNVSRGILRTNPCVTADTWVATSDGRRQVSELIGTQFNALVDGRSYKSTPAGFWSTGIKPVYELRTDAGFSVKLTGNHEVSCERNGRFVWVAAEDLKPGDKIRLHNHFYTGSHDENQFDTGWVIGSLIGDGTFAQADGKSDQARLCFWGPDQSYMANLALSRVSKLVSHRSDLGVVRHAVNNTSHVQCAGLASLAAMYGVVPGNKVITQELEKQPLSVLAGLLSGLFDADGSVQGDTNKGVSIRLSQVNLENLKAAQRILARLGVISKIYTNRRKSGLRSLPDGKGGHADYNCQACHELVISKSNIGEFAAVVGFSEPAKRQRLEQLLSSYDRKPNKERFTTRLVDLVPLGAQEVYDCTVPGPSAFDANGIYVHNCAEISLSLTPSPDPIFGTGGGGQFCNLTAVVARPDDTVNTLRMKVRIATILGVYQSKLTKFNYIRPRWREVCERDRLLGVDITGQRDCPLIQQAGVLDLLREDARMVAYQYANAEGISRPAAITCGKPSGQSSQLLNCSSGMHSRYSQYYMRRVQLDSRSDVAQYLLSIGWPCVPLAEKNDGEASPILVFDFPIASPPGSNDRNSETALETCNRYLNIVRHWLGDIGHNQSVTVYVAPDEWDAVGDWVYAHFDEITGMSFFPKSDHVYKNAPYEELTHEQYQASLASLPTSFDAEAMAVFHVANNVVSEGSTELACAGGSCEI